MFTFVPLIISGIFFASNAPEPRSQIAYIDCLFLYVPTCRFRRKPRKLTQLNEKMRFGDDRHGSQLGRTGAIDYVAAVLTLREHPYRLFLVLIVSADQALFPVPNEHRVNILCLYHRRHGPKVSSLSFTKALQW